MKMNRSTSKFGILDFIFYNFVLTRVSDFIVIFRRLIIVRSVFLVLIVF